MTHNNGTTLNTSATRAAKARLARRLGRSSYNVLVGGQLSFFTLAGLIFLASLTNNPPGNAMNGIALTASLGLICFMFAKWYKFDLEPLPPEHDSTGHISDHSLANRLSGDILGRIPAGANPSPQDLWHTLADHWQVFFITNHCLLPAKVIFQHLSNNPHDTQKIWELTQQLADQQHRPIIQPGHIAIACILSSPNLRPLLTQAKLSSDDILSINAWLGRVLQQEEVDPPFFGGIGRDWANGFTPTLNRFGTNVSLQVERSGGNFGTLAQSPGVTAIQNSFAQGAHAIALVGADGIGKTSHVHALAQLLLEGNVVPSLQYNQIFSLNPSVLLSNARRQGELEEIVLSLMGESVQAGHIILFLDDAQLFFTNGEGSVDLTQILLPVVQSGRVRLIMAMDPSDYQRLRTHNTAFANLLTPVMLQEAPQAEIMNILQDTALSLEAQHKTLITFEAIREAYRLSGRYDTENAYPGKAINLLEQALTHTNHGVITTESVQQAIEQTRGVKASSAAPAEASQLLHLEELIHQRMINQTRAVSVVASALRRARAGVSSPNRPIGSFLFLGPTGVGKTELAKAIAATYFHDEANMIRLDMSEYQQPDDVRRLLSNGQEDTNSLILAVRRQPFSVILLDEIEKAHPNILNLLLQMLDEGTLTDTGGRAASFKDCVIICTSNAGADTIRQRIEQGEELESFEDELTNKLINSGQFKPELLNRFDEIVLFRPLKPEELAQVVQLMVQGINKTLAAQNITVKLTDKSIYKIVETGNDPRLGARPMRRALQRAVENGVANRILTGQAQAGDTITLDVGDLSL